MDGAFTGEGIVGGVIGTLASLPVREGFCRGILSNEAGAGTSSMAHSRGVHLSPSTSGLLGVMEVAFDTLLLCSLTAFAVLASHKDVPSSVSPMSLILSAVSSALGDAAALLLLFSVFVFAYATVICWYYYGRESLGFLLGSRLRGTYLLLYIFACCFGFLLGEERLISISDILIFTLTALTSFAIIKGSDRIVALSEPHRGIITRLSSLVKIKEVLSSKEGHLQEPKEPR